MKKYKIPIVRRVRFYGLPATLLFILSILVSGCFHSSGESSSNAAKPCVLEQSTLGKCTLG